MRKFIKIFLVFVICISCNENGPEIPPVREVIQHSPKDTLKESIDMTNEIHSDFPSKEQIPIKHHKDTILVISIGTEYNFKDIKEIRVGKHVTKPLKYDEDLTKVSYKIPYEYLDTTPEIIYKP